MWLAARMIRSPWCAFIVRLLILVGSRRRVLLQHSTTPGPLVRAERPGFAARAVTGSGARSWRRATTGPTALLVVYPMRCHRQEAEVEVSWRPRCVRG